MNPNKQGFFGGLESLRGLAALYVVLFHLTPLVRSPATSNVFVENGYVMVDLFFVLSGFVIYHTYGAKIKAPRDIVQFMFLRFGRLYPLHLATLLLFLGVETAKYIGEVKFGMVAHETNAFSFSNGPAFIANLFLVQPFFPFSNLTFNHPSWSIGTEFYTYILFALTIYFTRNKTGLRLVASGVLLSALCSLFFYHSYYLNPRAGLCFLRCVVGFFTGVLAYEVFLASRWIFRWGKPIELGLLAILAVYLCFKPPQSAGWDYLVLPIFALLIIVVAGPSPGMVSVILNTRPLRWLGKVSYSIYMVHLFVEMMVSRLYGPVLTHLARLIKSMVSLQTVDLILGFVFTLFTVLVVLLLSKVSYQWIEHPFQLKFRDLARVYFPENSPPPVQNDLAAAK